MKFRADLLLRSVNDEFYIVDPQNDLADLSRLYHLTPAVVFLWMEFKGKTFTEDTLINALMNKKPKNRTKAIMTVQYILTCFRQYGFLEDN